MRPNLRPSVRTPNNRLQDEIDALASSRGSDGDTASSHEGVLTSLLNEMDGVQELLGVTIIGATNRPDAIVSYDFGDYTLLTIPR